MHEVFKKLNEVDVMYNSLHLLEKKRDRMGLTKEEEKKLMDMKIKYFTRCDQVIDEIVTLCISGIITKEGNTALQEIQKIIPWHGGTMVNREEVDSIKAVENKLTEDQREFLDKQLTTLHYEVFMSIEKFFNSEKGQEYFKELGKIVSSSETGDVMNALSYIDNIYREFGEMLGVDLPDVKIVRG